MKLFENIAIEQVILSFAVAVAGTVFVSISTQLGSASWRWAFHFITTTRRQRRHENYVEVRRRIRSEAYLLYKSGLAKNLMVPPSIMNFCVLLLLLLIAAGEPADRIAILLFVTFLVIAGGFVLVVLSIETARNNAARAFRAGLRRDRRTKQFIWPPTKTPG